jgi:ATP-dependent protease HslVU (ClpYQ) peptidase subunit
MTCIIGLVREGAVYMGGDSAAASGWNVQITQEPKVFRRDDILIGFTTSFRMGQLLHYKMALTARPENVSDIAYLVTVFAEDVRSCLKAGGWSEIDKNTEKGGQFLIGYHGKLYTMDSDFQVLHLGDMNAVGCGREYALGAMLALADKPPRERLLRSLECAAAMCASVRAPFVIESMEAGA